jgi:hypothetical protein
MNTIRACAMCGAMPPSERISDAEWATVVHLIQPYGTFKMSFCDECAAKLTTGRNFNERGWWVG